VDLIKKNTTLIIELLTNIQNKNTEPLPELESLNELIEGNDPVLRKWTNGKYKCTSLEEFIKRYIKIADNLTPALIRDYLISDKTGKQYSDNSIETSLKLYGLGRKSK
jgi:radical SAM superfamily enzyme